MNLSFNQILKDHGVLFSKNPLTADIIASEITLNRKYKLAKLFLPFKKFIVWTDEPRYDCRTEKFKIGNSVYMNVYSGDVFFHNLHFLGSYHFNRLCNLGIDLKTPPGQPLTIQTLKAKKKFCVAVFKYQDPLKSVLMIYGKNADLYVRRQNLAIFFYTRNKADIVGNDWPKNIKTIESSGFETNNNTWWNRKIEMLTDYKFNICFENTIFPNYCTEKIWHAIAGGCLPIYYGKGTAIYNTFPKNSFVDAADFNSDKHLLFFLENLSPHEHIRRYNECLKVMHQSCIQKIESLDGDDEIVDRFIVNVRQLVKSK